jgi:hypothetical protein
MGQIMREIADPRMTRDDVALTYAFGLRQDPKGMNEMDWKRVNDAILARWSMNALRYIKERAWKYASRPQGLTG